MTERSVVVSNALQHHQLCSLLRTSGVEWADEPCGGNRARFTITASDEQWGPVGAWVERIRATVEVLR